MERGDERLIRETFLTFTAGWRKAVLKALKRVREQFAEHLEIVDQVHALLSGQQG